MTTYRDRVADTVPAVKRIVETRRKSIAAALADPRFNNDYRAKLISEANDKARTELAALRVARDAAIEAERAAITRARTVKVDPNTAILAQLQAERAWNRTVRRLDAGADPLVVVQEAAKAGDRAMLDILAEEVPSYLEAKQSSRQAIDGVATMIGRAIEPLKTDAERQTDTREAALEKAVYVADFSLGHAEHELSTEQPVPILPLADGGTVTVGQD